MWYNIVHLIKYITFATQNFHRSDTDRFFGKDKSMNVYRKGNPIERRMGLKWRVASLPDNGQRFSFSAFGTQSRVDMHTHAYVSVHTCTYSYTYVSSVTCYLVLTHYLTLDRLIALSLRLLSLPLPYPFLLSTEWATKRFSFVRGVNEVSHERSCATNSLQPKYFLSRTVRQIEKTK